MLAVLDTMIQPYEGKPGTYAVYYNILDGDQHGRPPNCYNFDTSEKSCLYMIAKNNNMVTMGVWAFVILNLAVCFRRWYTMMLFDYC